MDIFQQILLTAILQLSFFTFFYKFGFVIAKFIGRRVCPVCFSVGSTWLTFILLKLFGIVDINHYLIALLLSQSVVGVSYLIDEFILVRNVSISDYILKFGIIIYGTFSVGIFAFVNTTIGFFMFLPIILFGFYALTPNSYGH